MNTIDFHLVVPRTGIQRFGITLDPVALLLGVSLTAILTEALGPVLSGPARLVSAGGVDHDVFPVLLRPGCGVTIDLGRYSKGHLRGEVGLHNVKGHFALQVPDTFKMAAELGLQKEIAAGRARFVGYSPLAQGGHAALFEADPTAEVEWTLEVFSGVKLGFVFG